ncbi:MAG: penicillin-binding transpeptidase domain-containing protein [Syntrophorhabdaceae bacterium]|nr:penicillin-binding transpeptidase domain-containing protein [Syntrophorhabdaceae bacterium]
MIVAVLFVLCGSFSNAADADVAEDADVVAFEGLSGFSRLHEESAMEQADSLKVSDLLKSGKTKKVFPDGSSLILTIDKGLQSEIFNLFLRYDPPYGAFVAMEPSTGRVVALVGYRKGGKSDPWLALRAIYPAASLVKVITASAAIELGKISPSDEVWYQGGLYSINRAGIHSDFGSASMTFEEAFARSANGVFGRVTVRDVGTSALMTYLDKFGFGSPIPFDMPVEPSRAEVPSDEYELARTGAGFGEVYASPLHMAMVMAALASDGRMPRPILIDRIVGADGNVEYESAPAIFQDAVYPETAQALVRMMVKTIEMGTSRRAFGTPDKTPLLQGMEVAGKTGSLSGWTPRLHFGWFAGFAPVDSPRLALAALVANDVQWKIRGSYVGKEAFSFYFGYPPSDPPPPHYVKSKGKSVRKINKAGKKKNTKTVKAKPVKKKPKRQNRARVSIAERHACASAGYNMEAAWTSNV